MRKSRLVDLRIFLRLLGYGRFPIKDSKLILRRKSMEKNISMNKMGIVPVKKLML